MTDTTPTPVLAELSGADLATAYAERRMSPVDVARDLIADIEERNPLINAFSDFDPDRVLGDAAASSRIKS